MATKKHFHNVVQLSAAQILTCFWLHVIGTGTDCLLKCSFGSLNLFVYPLPVPRVQKGNNHINIIKIGSYKQDVYMKSDRTGSKQETSI